MTDVSTTCAETVPPPPTPHMRYGTLASAKVVEMSVTNNSPLISGLQSPDDLFQSRNHILSRLCSNGARSPEATNIWPRATENIFLVAGPGDLLVLVS